MGAATQVSRTLRGITDQEGFDIASWPGVDEGALPPEKLRIYLVRKKAVRLYLLDGASDSTLQEKCGLCVSNVYRLVRYRCTSGHPDGRIWGWRALVPDVRIRGYARQRPVRPTATGRGVSGAMQLSLDLEPDLAQRLEVRILRTCSGTQLGEVGREINVLFRWWVGELRKLQYEVRNQWPFNTQSMGYWSLYRHVKRVLSANPLRAAKVVGGPALAAKFKSGDGVNRPVLVALDRVEMDGHKLDGRFVVMIPQMDGGWSPKLVHRIWVIVILEVVSRAVLGYHLSFNVELKKEDILRSIKSALTRWHQRDISFSDQAYKGEAALPSGHLDRYVGLCWNETSVDGALAETCRTVREKLELVVGSTLLDPSAGYPSRRSKDDRPFIETFFRALGDRGLQRISNTTGGKPSDKQQRDPEKVAVVNQVQLEYLEELIDVLIANYNATPHSGLGHRTPLQMLDFLTSPERMTPRYADPDLVQGLLSVRKLCAVRGGYEQGRRPYVEFLGARYSSDVLAQRSDLVGKKIWISNHLENDARVALASLADGTELGVLRAQPPWHRTPHSLAVRSAIRSMVARRRFDIAHGGDAVATFMDFVEQHGTRGRLPLHPAYLELKRILLEYSDFRSDAEHVEQARMRLGAEATAGQVLIEEAASIGGSVLGARPGPAPRSSTLPPPRKAAN